MSTAGGRLAEDEAAKFLARKGFKIIAQNWRTRWCEIDIVAQQANTIYFVEVKYRASNRFGAGFDYITSRKQRQMHFAAEFWIAKHGKDQDYRLAAIELSGDPPQVDGWLDDI
ncbi:MAG: YraN family protein [Candidatus Saccharimonadales bacterium]